MPSPTGSKAGRLPRRDGRRALALGADVASGFPDETTRAGRSLALQALGVELALAEGVPADRLILGAVPDWVAEDGRRKAILVQAWLRAPTFPDHRLFVADPGPTYRRPSTALVAALAGSGVARTQRPVRAGRRAGRDLRAAASSAAALRTGSATGCCTRMRRSPPA